MVQSPFKLFEPYGSNDKNIFFGRDAEIYALYNLLEQTRLVLIYGASGTGKTSLIHAGLPKIFMQTDWFQISVKRRDNINDSIRNELSKISVHANSNDLVQSVNSVFEKSWIPIYLVFDQFEELFTLGNHEERVQFFTELQTLLDTPLPCKIILLMREEYIGHLYEYEPLLPTLFDKRFRVEPMKDVTVKDVITQICQAGSVELEKGQRTADQILQQVKEGKQAVHLPYLQVYLHYLYENALITLEKSLFTEGGIKMVGQLGNVLKRFIETQLEAARLHFAKLGLPDDFAARLLDEFATDEATKQSRKTTELANSLKTERGKVKDALHYFSEKKLLRPDEDDVERYEPVHDVVAKQIHELRSVEDKEFKAFVRQLQLAFEAWERDSKPTQRLLNELDLSKITIYDKRLKKLTNYDNQFADLISKSREQVTYLQKRERQRRQILLGITVMALIGLLIAIIFYFQANIAKEEAKEQTRIAEKALEDVRIEQVEKERQRQEAIRQKQEADFQKQQVIEQQKLTEEQKKAAIDALEAKKQEELEKNKLKFEELINMADRQFKGQEYKNAKKMYEEALLLSTTPEKNNYIKSQINQCNIHIKQ
jgi:hypothetical protein